MYSIQALWYKAIILKEGVPNDVVYTKNCFGHSHDMAWNNLMNALDKNEQVISISVVGTFNDYCDQHQIGKAQRTQVYQKGYQEDLPDGAA